MASTTLTYPPPTYPTLVTIISVVRTDTGANVPATILAGDAMGAWVLTVTEPQAGLTYAYSLQTAFSGGVTGITNGFLNGTATPVGYYTSYAQLCNKYGSDNIAKWSNLNNDTVGPNLANIQTGISVAEDQLNQYWYNSAYNTPLTPVGPMIQDWGTTGAAYWIYTTRGLFEEDNIGNRLKQGYLQMMMAMAAYKGGALPFGCARRWPSPTAAVRAGW